MNLSILFWFYKEPEICKNRLEILKKNNPSLKIYGLYGGGLKQVENFQKILGSLLDDFYVSPYKDTDWKWINGDLMILDWYNKRGKNFTWDSMAIIQWDMLIFDSLKNQFPNLDKDQIFLSGLKRLDKHTEESWDWTQTSGKERINYLAFLKYVKEKYGYNEDPPLCSLFIFEIFPRIFFEKYLEVENKEIGMLEYKIPIYAEIFKIPFYQKDLGVLWDENYKQFPLNAIPKEIETSYINSELQNPKGWRIFHPYFKIWDNF